MLHAACELSQRRGHYRFRVALFEPFEHRVPEQNMRQPVSCEARQIMNMRLGESKQRVPGNAKVVDDLPLSVPVDSAEKHVITVGTGRQMAFEEQ